MKKEKRRRESLVDDPGPVAHVAPDSYVRGVGGKERERDIIVGGFRPQLMPPKEQPSEEEEEEEEGRIEQRRRERANFKTVCISSLFTSQHSIKLYVLQHI
jgi:hypothetical protein